MRNLLGFINRNRYPAFSLFICIVAYGIFIPWLGFYWDDWQYIFPIISNRFEDLPIILSLDRPYAFWTVIVSAPILGYSPIKWQIFTLLFRWASAVAMYWALSFIWPTQTKSNWLMAMLYAVSPIFLWQPASVTFSQHFISAFLFFLSLGAMGWVIKAKKWATLFTAFALLGELLHLITIEYFVGLELLRPLYIYWVINQTNQRTKVTVREVTRIWLPYGVLLISFSYWRFFLANLDRNSIALGSFQKFTNRVVQSYIHVLWDAWVRALNGLVASFADSFTLFSWGMGLLVFLIFFLHVSKLSNARNNETGDIDWQKQSALLGLIAIFFGLIPIWLIGKSPLSTGLAHDRFSIPALFGASVLSISVITFVTKQGKIRDLIVGILLLLAVATHVRSGNIFRQVWKNQANFYSQMRWRAPDIEPDTALFTFGNISGRMNENTTGFAINSIYPQSQENKHLDYWIYDLEIGEAEWDFSSIEGDQLYGRTRGLEAAAKYPEDIVLFYLPNSGCLWVLTPLDKNNHYVPSELRELAQFSNLGRIHPNASYHPDILYPKSSSSQTWCFFYQQAALAQQQANWELVIELMDEASSKGFSPNNDVELVPLIEAQTQMGNWDMALEISNFDARHVKARILFCSLWAKMSSDPEVFIPIEVSDEILSRSDCMEIN